jgi:hypothetical protein
MQAESTEGSGTELALRSEALDEQQIVAETKGEVISQYFNEMQGINRIQLSYAGIKWVARIMAQKGEPISVEEHYVAESGDGRSWLARAKALNLKTREVRWGYAEQPRFTSQTFYSKDGSREELKPIPFAYVLAASKAQRNALRAFIPEIVVQEAYKEYKNPPKGAKDVTPKADPSK